MKQFAKYLFFVIFDFVFNLLLSKDGNFLVQTATSVSICANNIFSVFSGMADLSQKCCEHCQPSAEKQLSQSKT